MRQEQERSHELGLVTEAVSARGAWVPWLTPAEMVLSLKQDLVSLVRRGHARDLSLTGLIFEFLPLEASRDQGE